MINCLIGIPVVILAYGVSFFYVYLYFKNPNTFKFRDPISTYIENKFILKYFKNRLAIWFANFLISLIVAITYLALTVLSFGMTVECFK
jgi:ABC-type uncharacterized transport system permease subunit